MVGVTALLAYFLLAEDTRRPAAPYPPSLVLAGIEWDAGTWRQLAPGSDLWPVTWAADGHLYTAWGDGGGFGGTNADGRVSMGFARIEGGPEEFRAVNVNGGVNPEKGTSFGCKDCGKTAGLLSVSGVLYAWVNMQNAATADTRLAWSVDFAKTWQFANWKFPDPADPTFFPSSFLNFRQDYAGSRDQYVYSFGGRWVPTQGAENDMFLARVPRDRIRERSAYEFFAGTDGQGVPIWSADITARRSVFSDPNGVPNAALASVVYHPVLKRYLLTVAHRAAGGSNLPPLPNLGIFDAPQPWGPWTTVAYYDDWLSHNRNDLALVYTFPTKWLSDDARTLWLVYSGWPEADGFRLIRAKLTLSPMALVPTGVSVAKRPPP